MNSHPITVCQLLFELNLGGGEVLASRLARRLSGSYRMIFACLEQSGTLGERLHDDGFPIHVLNKRPGVDRTTIRRLRALFRQERVELVHAHHYGPFIYAAAARAPSSQPPVVLTEHGRPLVDEPGPGRVIVNRVLLRRRDRIIGVGESVRRALIAKERFPARRVDVVPNGIDLSAFEATEDDRLAIRRELGLEPTDFVIFHVARLESIKDHATSLRTLGRVVARHDRTRLVLVGDGAEALAIDGLIEQLGLQRNVLCLGQRTDVPRLLRTADLAVLTSLSEGIPLALIEGMAAGLPVVATRVGGVPEVVEEGVTGLLAPSGDDALLAEHILLLAGDPALRHRLGQAGRARAFALFSEDRMCAMYDRLYRTILGTRTQVLADAPEQISSTLS